MKNLATSLRLSLYVSRRQIKVYSATYGVRNLVPYTLFTELAEVVESGNG